MMAEFDYGGICRLCLSVNSPSLFTLSGEQIILDKITTCFSINIRIEDPFPKQICRECKDKIEAMHAYHQKVNKNEKLLLSKLKTANGLNELYYDLKNPGIEKKFVFNIESNSLKPTFNELKSYNDDLKIYQSTVLSLSTETGCIGIQPLSFKEDRSLSPLDDAVDFNDDVTNLVNPIGFEEKQRKEAQLKFAVPTSDDIKADDKNQFKCLTCYEYLGSKNLLLLHYNTRHKAMEGEVKAKCETVNIDGVVKYKCMHCDQVTENKRKARQHLRQHASESLFLCRVCGRTYLTAYEIVRHGRAHDGSKVYCSHNCGYSTPYLGALIQHERRHRGDDYKYKCEECGKGFEVKTWYVQHQNMHKGLKPFVCDICGVAFHMDRYLTAHKSSVHPQTSGVKRYVCTHCYLPCDSRKAFTDHLKEHGVQSSFLCDVCGRELRSAERLRLHQRAHRALRPHACSMCDKTFTKKFNLQLHERTHTGEKSFACQLCGKRYSQRSTLRRHAHRHHSEPAHKCLRCDKAFATTTLLATHECM